MGYLKSRLLREENISDDYITNYWNVIIWDRANRNKVAKYVGAVMNGQQPIPLICENKNKFVEKVNALDNTRKY